MTRSANYPFGLTGFLALLAGIFYLASGPGGYRLAGEGGVIQRKV
jgi:hypothetical protein